MTERAVSALAVRWPGVRPCLVQDEAALGEYVVYLTRQLAEQPYNKQVGVSCWTCELPTWQTLET